MSLFPGFLGYSIKVSMVPPVSGGSCTPPRPGDGIEAGGIFGETSLHLERDPTFSDLCLTGSNVKMGWCKTLQGGFCATQPERNMRRCAKMRYENGSKPTQTNTWLVVSTILKNMSSSMGLGWHPIYEMEHNPFMFQTTNQNTVSHLSSQFLCPWTDQQDVLEPVVLPKRSPQQPTLRWWLNKLNTPKLIRIYFNPDLIQLH